jgi:hypothetical protein
VDASAKFTETDLNSLHDAELESLAIDRKSETANIVFVEVDGSKVGFEFGRVAAFRTSSLLFQNVVHGFRLSSVRPIADRDVERIARWVCSTEDDKLLIDPTMLAGFMAKVSSGSLILFHADPSWGAEIAILCESIARYQPAG